MVSSICKCLLLKCNDCSLTSGLFLRHEEIMHQLINIGTYGNKDDSVSNKHVNCQDPIKTIFICNSTLLPPDTHITILSPFYFTHKVLKCKYYPIFLCHLAALDTAACLEQSVRYFLSHSYTFWTKWDQTDGDDAFHSEKNIKVKFNIWIFILANPLLPFTFPTKPL